VGVATMVSDHFKYAINISENIIVPESQDAVAVRFQCLGSLRICRCGRSMLATVNLDNKARAVTCEIDDVLLDPDLPAEMGFADR
jgi:hypothetical protein